MEILDKNRFVIAFMMVCLNVISINLFSQEKRYLEEARDGFRWYLIKENGLESAQTENGASLIPFNRGYDWICYMTSDGGWFSVKKNGNVGACDKKGREIVAPGRYDDVSYRNKGGYVYCLIKRNNKQGVCDENGQEIISPKYDNVCLFGSEVYPYFGVELNGKAGLCDLSGKEIIGPEYDKYSVHYNEEDGYYRVKKDGKEGAFDKQGNQIVPPLYKTLRYSSNDFFEYKDDMGNWVSLGITLLDVDPTKPLQKDAQGRMLHTQSNGFKWYEIENDRHHGVLSLEGKTIIPLSMAFDSVYYMKNDGGWFGVKKEGKTGAYDLTGDKLLYPDRYDDVKCVKDNKGFICSFVKLNGFWGACDRYGKEIVEPKYDKIYYSASGAGCICVGLNGKIGICDKTNGNMIIAPAKYDVVNYICDQGFEYCLVGINKKWGVCDMRGQEIIEPKYDNVFVDESDGIKYFAIKLNGKSGACDMNGKVIVKPKYESLIYSSDNFEYLDASGNWVSTGISLDKRNSSSYASSSASSSANNASSNNSSSNSNTGMTQEEKVITVLQALSNIANTIQESRDQSSVTQPQPANNNGGNVAPNYNYSPNNSRNASSTKTKVDNTCLACHGTGKCSFCKGKGVILNQFDGNVYECVHCKGGGDCEHCHGRGYKIGYYTP